MNVTFDNPFDSIVHILIVDDDVINLQVLKKILKDMPGVRTHLVSSGYDALELAREQSFAVVLLDLSMPGMDGYETARRLQELDSMKEALIIFITAFFNCQESIRKGYEVGCVDYLHKPVNVVVVRNKVQIFVEMYRKRQELAHLLSLQEFQNRFIQRLLDLSKRILNMEPFEKTVEKIFEAVKEMTGGATGYAALLSADGHGDDVLFLDSEGRKYTAPPELPMPICGLRDEAYASGQVVYDNVFSNSEWMQYMPDGHVPLDNVLFAPLHYADTAQGILCIANKPGGFTQDDAVLMGAFGDLAALSLRNACLLSQLRESRKELNKAQNIANLGSFIIDLAKGQEEWSDGLYHVLGVDKHTTAPSFETLVSWVDAKDKAAVKDLLDSSFRSCGTRQTEFVLLPPGQNEKKTLLMRLDCDCDGKGCIIRVRGTCQDITEQRAIEQKVYISRQLEAVGSLASGVAHEINTPIQYMSNNVDFVDHTVQQLLRLFDENAGCLRKNVELGEELDWIKQELPLALEDFRQGLANVSRIVQTLQMLVPTTRQHKQQMHLNDMLRDLVDFAGKGSNSIIQVGLELDPGLPALPGSPEEISQVFLNVLINAFQAVTDRFHKDHGGEVIVRTAYENHEVVVAVEDNGTGIPEELGESVFHPFFSTREQGEGTGQGLAQARAIVESYRGSLQFVSTPGQGTTFIIRLPVLETGYSS